MVWFLFHSKTVFIGCWSIRHAPFRGKSSGATYQSLAMLGILYHFGQHLQRFILWIFYAMAIGQTVWMSMIIYVILTKNQRNHSQLSFQQRYKNKMDFLEKKLINMSHCRPHNHGRLCPHCYQSCDLTYYTKDIFSTKWPVVNSQFYTPNL